MDELSATVLSFWLARNVTGRRAGMAAVGADAELTRDAYLY
ncbi:hypothetical protein BN2497_3147 [Janthinobacterium sp. CG23_2]|nr:hypothetical protein BN2497_3147 [Janthinobacterium sp. CG23_2]CUU27971.1 hypothetical protein BN3177_3147 [Janthinobacterium sp. CG23_2]